jgi:hypothetical protein
MSYFLGAETISSKQVIIDQQKFYNKNTAPLLKIDFRTSLIKLNLYETMNLDV